MMAKESRCAGVPLAASAKRSPQEEYRTSPAGEASPARTLALVGDRIDDAPVEGGDGDGAAAEGDEDGDEPPPYAFCHQWPV
jgi:hypothetical protein